MPSGRNMHSNIKQILTLNDLSMKIQDRFRLDGKVAIVTGASKGIGKAITYALGQQGAQVVVSSRKQEAVDEVEKELKKESIEALLPYYPEHQD